MVRKSSLGLALFLVFVFAFSAAVTTYTPALSDPIPPGCCRLVNQCYPGTYVGLGVLNDYGVCVKAKNPGEFGCWPPGDCQITK